MKGNIFYCLGKGLMKGRRDAALKVLRFLVSRPDEVKVVASAGSVSEDLVRHNTRVNHQQNTWVRFN